MTWRRALVWFLAAGGNGMRPTWEPRPDTHQPPLISDHVFDPWEVPSTGRLICIHLQGGGICGRVEEEHAPASEDAEAE